MPDIGTQDERRPYRFLSWTLVLGAIYDFGFAALMLAAPGTLARAFALPLPEPRFYLDLLAVLLAMLGAAYLITARDPERHRGIVVVAIVGRLAGAIVLGLAAAQTGAHDGLWPPAAGDALFASVHAIGARGLFR